MNTISCCQRIQCCQEPLLVKSFIYNPTKPPTQDEFSLPRQNFQLTFKTIQILKLHLPARHIIAFTVAFFLVPHYHTKEANFILQTPLFPEGVKTPLSHLSTTTFPSSCTPFPLPKNQNITPTSFPLPNLNNPKQPAAINANGFGP